MTKIIDEYGRMIAIENLLTINSYASRRGIARRTVYNWIEGGRKPEIVIDGYRFLEWTAQDERDVLAARQKTDKNTGKG